MDVAYLDVHGLAGVEDGEGGGGVHAGGDPDGGGGGAQGGQLPRQRRRRRHFPGERGTKIRETTLAMFHNYNFQISRAVVVIVYVVHACVERVAPKFKCVQLYEIQIRTGLKDILESKVSGHLSFKTSASPFPVPHGWMGAEMEVLMRAFPELLTQGYPSALYRG